MSDIIPGARALRGGTWSKRCTKGSERKKSKSESIARKMLDKNSKGGCRKRKFATTNKDGGRKTKELNGSRNKKRSKAWCASAQKGGENENWSSMQVRYG